MNLVEIEQAMKDGVCPFTKKRYDCLNCDANSHKPDISNGSYCMHFSLSVTGPLQDPEHGWDDALRFFDDGDRIGAREILSRLLERGVERIPVGCCLESFCFKLGCCGHQIRHETKIN